KIPQRGQSFHVAKAHVLIANISQDWARLRLAAHRGPAPFSAAGDSARLRGFVTNLEHAFAGSASGLHELIKLMQFPNRFIKKSAEHEKSNEIAELHRAGQNCFCSDRDQEDNS